MNVVEKQAGYAGKILVVNLTSRSVSSIETQKYARDFIGGRGICQKLYWDLMPPEIGALDPESSLIFATGAFAGTGVPSSPKMFLAFKSPATYPHEEMFVSNVGGRVAGELKRAGFDGMVITGRSDKPVYLYVYGEGKVRIISAAHSIWGLDTFETQRELRRRHGTDAEILSIGPAGENLVRESIIQTCSNDSCAQGGPGCVMGSKNLKAIVVKGSGFIDIAHPEDLIADIAECNGIVSSKLSKGGMINPFRSLWQGFPSELAMEAEAGTARMKPAACDACGLACKTSFKYEDGYAAGVMKCSIGGGLYSKAAFGAECGDETSESAECDSPEDAEMPFMKIDRTVCKVMGEWEKWGINGHFMEMYSQGLDGLLYQLIDAGYITEENSGLPMDKIGEVEFAEALLRKVALREGEFGNSLAEGFARYCEKLGEGAMELWRRTYYPNESTINVDQFLMTKDFGEGNYADILNRAFGIRTSEGYAFYRLHVPNLDPMVFDEEKTTEAKRNASAYFFGRDDVLDNPDDPETGLVIAHYLMRQCMIRDATGQCGFVFPKMISSYTDDYVGRLYSARFLRDITGAEVTEEELADIYALRMLSLERMIRLREGHCASDDRVPDVFFEDGLRANDTTGFYDRQEFQEALHGYYRLLGWNEETGMPSAKLLGELGLEDVAAYFEEGE